MEQKNTISLAAVGQWFRLSKYADDMAFELAKQGLKDDDLAKELARRILEDMTTETPATQ